ncbi:MAG TPA: type II toxin-antitoxin system VapC family toxin [Kiritimatiellia bacterium]|nr:type II toxin-antitoxin system VapC family toxin [Kiritimatiellia bacterium]HMP34537.1 type II toxin-antitoxin system VapC family toxin [Kiritimatiellia bacterium]
MRLLLDTHIALWALTDSPHLPARARALIADPANEVFHSAASVWEIAIKHALARRDMPLSGDEAVRLFTEAGYVEVPVTARHAATTESLPPHHADLFDRLLVAQALVEPMHLITHDRQLMKYGHPVMYV